MPTPASAVHRCRPQRRPTTGRRHRSPASASERRHAVLDGERHCRQHQRARRHGDAPPLERVGVVLVAPDALDHRRDVQQQTAGKRRVEDAGMRRVPGGRAGQAIGAGKKERRARAGTIIGSATRTGTACSQGCRTSRPDLRGKYRIVMRDQRKRQRHRQPREDGERRAKKRRQHRLAPKQRSAGGRTGARQRGDDHQGRRVARPQQQQQHRRPDDRDHLDDRAEVDGNGADPEVQGERPRRRAFDMRHFRCPIRMADGHIERAAGAEAVGFAPAAARRRRRPEAATRNRRRGPSSRLRACRTTSPGRRPALAAGLPGGTSRTVTRPDNAPGTGGRAIGKRAASTLNNRRFAGKRRAMTRRRQKRAHRKQLQQRARHGQPDGERQKAPGPDEAR